MTFSDYSNIACDCGNSLKWQTQDSLVLICWYCRTVHKRNSSGLKQHEPASLKFDSPVKIDMTLKLNGSMYTVCGRTQWLCEFQNTQVWTLAGEHKMCTYLHETWGEFYLLRESKTPISTIALENIFPEKTISLGIDELYVTRIDKLNDFKREGETGIEYDYLKNTFQVYLRSEDQTKLYMAWIHSKTSVVLYELEYCEPLEGKTETQIRFLPIYS